LIAYSLGNFIFDQNFSGDTKKSAILNVYIKGGKVTSFETIPIRFTKDFRPEVINAI
jgi:poly-gamma-glutamate synthesis protein (capsule biosynthesis protein)